VEKHRHPRPGLCHGAGAGDKFFLQPPLSAATESGTDNWAQGTQAVRISYSLLADKAAVDRALKQVSEIQDGRETEVRQTPLVDLTKG